MEIKPFSDKIVIFFLSLMVAVLVPAASLPGFLSYLPFALISLFAVWMTVARRNELKASIAFIAYALLVMIAILTVSLLAYEPLDSVKRGILYFVPCFTIYFLVRSNERYRDSFDNSSMLYSAFYALMVFLAIYALLFGTPGDFDKGELPKIDVDLFGISFTQTAYGVWPLYRVGGVFGNPNTMGFMGVMALSLLFMITPGRHQYLKLIFGVIAIVGVLLSFSRTSIISAIIVAIFATVSSKKGGRVITVMVAVLAFYVVWSVFTEIGDSSRRFEFEFNSREDAWRILWGRFLEKPFFGYGLSAANEYLLENSHVQRAHNIYFLMLAEAGLAGGFFILLIMGASIYPSIRSIFINKSDKGFYLSSLAFMVVIFLSQFFEAFFFSSQLITFFWFFVLVVTWRRYVENRYMLREDL